MGAQLGRIAILRLHLLTVLDKDLEGGWAVHSFVLALGLEQSLYFWWGNSEFVIMCMERPLRNWVRNA
jgi:hypothetical protein